MFWEHQDSRAEGISPAAWQEAGPDKTLLHNEDIQALHNVLDQGLPSATFSHAAPPAKEG